MNSEFDTGNEYGQIFYCTSDDLDNAAMAALIYAKDCLPAGTPFYVYGPTKRSPDGTTWEFCWKFPRAVSGFANKRLVI